MLKHILRKRLTVVDEIVSIFDMVVTTGLVGIVIDSVSTGVLSVATVVVV